MARARTGPEPQYLKVKNHLREGIARGHWVAGDLLPSEAALSLEFGLSRMTVNRALRELHQEGLVQRVQGVGSFVAQLERISATLTVRDVHEEIQQRGHRHEARVHRLTSVAASPAQAALLDVAPGQTLFHSLIVHMENGVVIQCEERLVNPQCAPDYLAQDFTRTTPTHYLLQVAPLSEARWSIESTLPSAQEARLLHIERSEPCLVLRRTTYSRGLAVTWVKLTHPGSRYFLQGSFQA
ncbi:histidine utilization repressor [Roseateles sp. BYS180W]|uniref:Histidine utilization repressor n=1 Tax=Roseateles rivi TaxID=3299028 RepID=A0ABW7FVE1_9BURK